MKRMRGLTLLELLVAMSIFSVFGLFLFSLMRQSLEIYRSSRGVGELQDKEEHAFRALDEDLSCTYIGDPDGPGPKVEFLITHDRKWVPPEGVEVTNEIRQARTWSAGDPRALLIRLVRTLPGSELGDTVARFAGTYADPKAIIDGVDDLAESRALELIARDPDREDEAQRPPRGAGLEAPSNLMEVMYLLDTGESDLPGTYTLLRAIRSPIGGPGSFFAPGFLERLTPEWIARYARPVVSGISWFGVVAWGQETREWDAERVLSGEYLGQKNHDRSELNWDSTRGKIEAFGLHRGAASASVFEDDVFPSALHFVATFVQEGGTIQDATLVGDLPANLRNFRLSDAKALADFDRGGSRHLRIDDEWMEVQGVNGVEVRVARGVRGTTAARHAGASPVLIGRRVERTITIPASRSWFRGPGEGVK